MIVWVILDNPIERALLAASLAEEGYESKGLGSLSEARAELIRQIHPDFLVVEPQLSDMGSEAWEEIKKLALETRTIIIERIQGPNLSGDILMRRPVSVGEVTAKIKRLAGGD